MGALTRKTWIKRIVLNSCLGVKTKRSKMDQTIRVQDPSTNISYYDNNVYNVDGSLNQMSVAAESPNIPSNTSTPSLSTPYSSATLPETNPYYPSYSAMAQNYASFHGPEQTPYSYGFPGGLQYGKSGLGIGGSVDVVHSNLLVSKPPPLSRGEVEKEVMIASKPVANNEAANNAKKVGILFHIILL